MAEPNLQRPAEPARFIFRGDAVAADACARGFGVGLPRAACRAETSGARVALWLGPDEWLLMTPAGEADAVVQALAASLAGTAHSLVDVSHRQVAFLLSGAEADKILATGCPLDLHIPVFPVGMCTRTLFGKAEIVLWRRAADEFWIDVARSYAGYCRALLAQAAVDADAVR
jgi:sarcosine oxidase subunit gamma